MFNRGKLLSMYQEMNHDFNTLLEDVGKEVKSIQSVLPLLPEPARNTGLSPPVVSYQVIEDLMFCCEYTERRAQRLSIPFVGELEALIEGHAGNHQLFLKLGDNVAVACEKYADESRRYASSVRVTLQRVGQNPA